ncbi:MULTISPECIES: tRNA lysidine(34) synthetase TilS [unclassified Streptococcus]|uniref:tRNA lysidine(34) synthetase TilS n=1 Tax=unclassified Streptococcus TaxID=2608887 RepID=UPI001071ED0F|nr:MULTISPECIES: tRNA lysidine(34) synthetase TilS [unclassified Streptococcus]MBF0805834.1 tRNA lysidine(34) synthetase TilS [Streptococcus sp. 19428wA2_WM07]TFU28632.1 tRNA lysidine(34) synthetase TilS [Streptococcus sp. WM07]
MTLEANLLQHIVDRQFFRDHTKVLLALSGGKDSLYLLSFLYRYQEALGIRLGLAHVNYGQRPEAVWEEESLKRLAEDLSLPFYRRSFKGDFTEVTARDFRYDFFKSLMVEESYTALVTAHHRDDQVETILMRIIRGNHLESLQGISECQDFGPGQLLRPLLPFAKDELPQNVYFDDSSNTSPTYFRNRIRHQLLPLLQEENPKIAQGLLRLSQQVEEAYSLLNSLTTPLDPDHLEKWQEEPKSLQMYLLDQYLKNYPQLQRGSKSLEFLAHLLRKDGSHRTYLGQGYWLDKRYNRFEITTCPQSPKEVNPFWLEFGQVTDFGSFHFSFGKKPKGPILLEILVEAAPVLLRRRQEGDVFEWNGHQRKLRRWFINEKVPLQEREHAVIVEQNEKIQGILNTHGPCLSIQNEHGIMKARIYVQKIGKE